MIHIWRQFWTVILGFWVTGIQEGRGDELVGGIQADLSQQGLDYLATLAVKGLPEVFEGLKIPEQSGTGYEVKDMKLINVKPPKITVKFRPEENGIFANATIPSAGIVGAYSAGWGFASTSGILSANVTKLNVGLILKVLVGVGGIPVVNLTECKATVSETSLEFKSEDALSSAINAFKGLIEGFLVSSIDWIICGSAQLAVSENAKLMTTPPTPGKPMPTVPPGEEFVLCEDMPGMGGPKKADEASNMGGTSKFPMKDFGLNMSLTEEPKVGTHGFVLGFNGSILFKEQNSRITRVKYTHIKAPHNRRMVRILVSDMVANSFFEHIFIEQLGIIEQDIRSRTLNKVCKHCKGTIKAELIRPPVLKTSRENGAWLVVDGAIRAKARAFYKTLDLFWVDADLQFSVRPFVEHQKLKADVKIQRINIENDQRSGKFAKVVGFFLKRTPIVASEIVPDEVIPKIEQKLSKALSAGVPLPKVCGLRFYNTKVYPANNAVIIDTNIDYNAGPILKQFRRLMEAPPAQPKKE